MHFIKLGTGMGAVSPAKRDWTGEWFLHRHFWNLGRAPTRLGKEDDEWREGNIQRLLIMASLKSNISKSIRICVTKKKNYQEINTLSIKLKWTWNYTILNTQYINKILFVKNKNLWKFSYVLRTCRHEN